MIKPTGYYVLVEMEEVEQTVKEGPLVGFVMATDKEHEREQNGHDVGIVRAFGPTCFTGFNEIKGRTAGERAAQWGVKTGDKIEFNRYDGKVPRDERYQNFRIIQDMHIIGVLNDELPEVEAEEQEIEEVSPDEKRASPYGWTPLFHWFQ